MLGPAQLLRLGRIVKRGDGTAGPSESALGRLVKGATVGPANGKDAAFALDHDVAPIGRGLRHQGEATAMTSRQWAWTLDQAADPLGSGAGLSEPPPGQDQPGPPITGRRPLLRSGPKTPVVEKLLSAPFT